MGKNMEYPCFRQGAVRDGESRPALALRGSRLQDRVLPRRTNSASPSPGARNQQGMLGVSLGMDETAAWHIALWEIELQKYFAEDE